ncbi:MAG: (2Fe-2S)-binding protein [Gammaproteobacteria bacterium]|nr:(2Fe-2S)-binding protein [Gammaproteobacteria bacterium]|tara:strand:- start:245 stop:433 length:189 start_codon:yes stop_codon:yes gene_type:complete
MYVCICRQITDQQIRDVCRDGVTSMTDLRSRLGVASDCGKCGKLAKNIVKEFAKSTPFNNTG